MRKNTSFYIKLRLLNRIVRNHSSSTSKKKKGKHIAKSHLAHTHTFFTFSVELSAPFKFINQSVREPVIVLFFPVRAWFLICAFEKKVKPNTGKKQKREEEEDEKKIREFVSDL